MRQAPIILLWTSLLLVALYGPTAAGFPVINSFDDLKAQLISFRLREKTKTEVEEKTVTITTGGALPQFVMVQRDGVMVLDKDATEKVRKKRPEKVRTETRQVRERKKVVVGVNADELKFLLDELFERFGTDPVAIRSWLEIYEKARDDSVKSAIMGHIYDVAGEYDIAPLFVSGFADVPDPEFLTSPQEQAAFAAMMFRAQTVLLPVLATVRLLATADDAIEPVLIQVIQEPKTLPIVPPLAFLLLSRTHGTPGQEFLLQVALADKVHATFAWEALARRRAPVDLASLKRAMASKTPAVRVGVVRYVSSMRREDALPFLVKMGGGTAISEIEFFSIWLALENICGKGKVPYDSKLWAKAGSLGGAAPSVVEPDPQENQGEEQETNAQSYYDLDMTSRRIVFICDRSISMTAGGKWNQLLQNLMGAVQGLSSDYKFTAVFYGVSIEEFSRRLVPASKPAMTRFQKFVQGLEPGGDYTYTSRGIDSGLAIPRVNTAYLLSDGLPYGESPMASFGAWQQRDPSGLVILHTISLQAEKPFQDDMLFLLSQLGWGDFVACTDGRLKYFISADRQTVKCREEKEDDEALAVPEEKDGKEKRKAEPEKKDDAASAAPEGEGAQEPATAEPDAKAEPATDEKTEPATKTEKPAANADSQPARQEQQPKNGQGK
ncbi:MAG: hypothetical protein A3K19_21120 [Lentisphaerae bacterium RIFOXYB12_FULL_65_16]|nr:MAG: hypothetical protein A3K18_08095 [Lentisphaerae bacterium RIFOXYA12_64_32]OGV93982.1 MAG: hypothetical protein A3K19_21120 [Lentisphaerae bacterium RIFOXYB12_FULL_65_16]